LLKVWKQAFDFVRWQSGQQPVLTGIYVSRRSSHHLISTFACGGTQKRPLVPQVRQSISRMCASTHMNHGVEHELEEESPTRFQTAKYLFTGTG